MTRLRYAVGVAGFIVADPQESVDRVVKRLRRGERFDYAVDPDWEHHLHKLLAQPLPCAALAEFETLWTEVVSLLAAKGLQLGRGTYGGWDDGGKALARAAWCLTRHLEPARVVETGVARGITTRIVLEALERQGGGRLWSIDLPPPDWSLHAQIAAAVPATLRDRWTYLRGRSTQHLPRLLATLGSIDLFIHDSLHTERNLRFEMERAWQALRPGGVLLCDDIDRNWGFRICTARLSGGESLVAEHDDKRALFGVVRKV